MAYVPIPGKLMFSTVPLALYLVILRILRYFLVTLKFSFVGM